MDLAPPAPAMSETIELSVVVPVYDEEESLPTLYEEIVRALEPCSRSWELVFVNDHSRDHSLKVMLELRARDRRVRIVHFRRNFGQTAAMAAGFDQARGRIVVTLDGDLQNDPADIPRLLERIEQGCDFVAGWRRSRQDGFVLRRLPSIVANRLIGWVTGVPIHDTGCTLKAMRRELLLDMPIYAEQHRFLPALYAGAGARVAELVVNHRPRRFGHSKYGLGRATRVALDLFTIKLISSFSRRPGQYFGLLALPFSLVILGFVLFAVLRADEIGPRGDWGHVGVLVVLLFLSLIVYFVLLGLLAELAVKVSGVHRGARGLPRFAPTWSDAR